MRTRFLLAAFAVLTVPAMAQTPAGAPAPPPTLRGTPAEPYTFISAEEVAKRAFRPGPVNSTVVSDHEGYFVEFVKRGDSGNSTEAHMHWIDYITILAGEGTLTYGGAVTNPTTTNPDEPRGTAPMTGGTVQRLRPGDFLVIPAGLWHSFSATPGNTLNYVIFKMKR
jgi:quercetin dioxygenase-like cupin family protein